MTNLPCTRISPSLSGMPDTDVPTLWPPFGPPPRSGNSVNLRWLLLNATLDKSLVPWLPQLLLRLCSSFRGDQLKRLLASCPAFVSYALFPSEWRWFTTLRSNSIYTYVNCIFMQLAFITWLFQRKISIDKISLIKEGCFIRHVPKLF